MKVFPLFDDFENYIDNNKKLNKFSKCDLNRIYVDKYINIKLFKMILTKIRIKTFWVEIYFYSSLLLLTIFLLVCLLTYS